MKQSFSTDAEYAGKHKQTRRERFLLEMDQVVPWCGLIALIEPHYLGRRRAVATPGQHRRWHLIHAPSSTKNKDGKRDPEMHSTKKGNQYYFCMKAQIGVDAESGLVHHVVGTAANVADVTQIDKVLHGEENLVSLDAAYVSGKVIWQIAARRSSYKRSLLYRVKRLIERAKDEYLFRVIKRQFGYVKVRFRGLAKNTAQLVMLFALSNLWMARKHLRVAGEVRP